MSVENGQESPFILLMKQYQNYVLIGLGVVALVVVYFTFIKEDKRYGTWRYGLCRVFLEQYAQYPTNLVILTVGEKQNSAQIGYLITNSYGSQYSQLMECFYNINQNNVTLNKVTIDRKLYKGDLLEGFNKTIPILLNGGDLDLVIPDRLSQSITGLKF